MSRPRPLLNQSVDYTCYNVPSTSLKTSGCELRCVLELGSVEFESDMALLSWCVLASLALLVAGEVDECQVYYGGLIFPEGSRRNPEHGLHWSKTQSKRDRERGSGSGRGGGGVCWLYKVLCFGSLVSKPAPDWNGTAVLDGEFKEMTLKDFRGE